MINIFRLWFPPKTPVENLEEESITITESKYPLSMVYYAWMDGGVSQKWHDYCKGQLWSIDNAFYQSIEIFCQDYEYNHSPEPSHIDGNPMGAMLKEYRRFVEWKIREEWLMSAFPILAISLKNLDDKVSVYEEAWDVDLTEAHPRIAMESSHIMK